MKKSIYLIAVLLLLSLVQVKAQNTVCMLDTLPSSISTDMKIMKILVDNSGNLFVGGFYYSPIGGNYSGSMNFFLQKYNPNKQLLWEKLIAPTYSSNHKGSYLTGLDLDDSGNVYVSGSFFGPILSLDTISISFPYPSNYKDWRHSFVAKFNSSGSIQWMVYSRKVNSVGSLNGLAADLQYVDDQHIYVGMVKSATMLFTDGTSRTVGGEFSMFIINSDGEFVSDYTATNYYNLQFMYPNTAQGFPAYTSWGREYAIRPKIRVSNSGVPYMTTYFVSDHIIVGSQKLFCYPKTSNTNYWTNVVARVDTNNSSYAFRGMGSLYQSNYYHPTPFALDNSENVYLAAEWSNNNIIIDSNNIPQASSGSVVTKYDKQGNLLWYSTSSLCHIYELHVDKNNNVVVVGEYEDSIRITPPTGSSQTLIASNTSKNVFAYTLGKDGSIKGMIDIHGSYDAAYMGSYLSDCGMLTLLAKCNGNTYMGNSGMINNLNNVIIAKTSPYTSCSSSNCKFLYIKGVKKQLSNCNYSNINIKWNFTGLTNLNLYYSLDSGATYTLGAGNIPAVLGQYNWTPPSAVQNSSLRVKISGIGADSIFSDYYDISPHISGTKTIGGINPDYVDFGAAIDDLQKYGICSNVTFKVRNGIYNEQFRLNPFPGMEQYHVSFEAESANNPSIIVQDSLQDFSFYWFLKFVGIQNVSFKNIKFRARHNNRFLLFETANMKENAYCKNIVFDSCEFNYFWFTGKSITIKNSIFRHPYTNFSPFVLTGINVDTLGNDFRIYNNTFFNNSDVTYQMLSNLSIYNNTFRDSSSIIIIDGLQNNNIYNNKVIRARDLWLYINGQDTRVRIYNNFISKGASNQKFVISLYQNEKVEINNNSFRGAYYPLVMADICDTVHMINNVLTTKGNYAAIEVNSSSNQTIISDYNNFYSNQFIKYNGQNKSLSDWQSVSNQDMHSTTLDPLYVNDTILRIHNTALENMGTPISYIKYDIDGEIRSPFTPDIGADEFSLAGIEDNANDFDVKLYPNPAIGVVNIDINGQTKGNISVQIFNVNGQLVYTQLYSIKKGIKLNISSLNQGVYFVKVFDNGSLFSLQKLMIQ